MSPRRRALLALTWAIAGVLVLAFVASVVGPTHAVAGDAHYVLATARSLAFDGDLDLTNQYWVMGDRWGLGRDPAHDGWRLPPREIGAALAMVPGLLVHHALALPDRLEPTFAVLLAAASPALTWLGCLACLDAIDERAERDDRARAPARAWQAAAIVLASVVPFYAVGRAGYAHAPDAAACAWLTWALLARRSPVVIGALLACAVLVRLQNLLWIAWPLLELTRWSSPSPSRTPRDLLVIVAIGSLGLAPQAWLALAHPGSVGGAIRWELGFFDLDQLGLDLARVLVGVHGLASFTPLMGLGLVGLIVAKQWRPLAVVAAMIVLCACVRDVDGGDAFGARRLAGLVPVLGVGVAIAWDRWGWVRIVAGLAVVGNLVLVGLAIGGWISLASR